MNYAFFGCSHTSSIPENNWRNYVEILAEKYPQHNFYNFAQPASSLSFSAHFQKLVDKYFDFDYKILQVTDPHRFTSITDFDVKEYTIQKTDNYFVLDIDVRNHFIETITPGTIIPKYLVYPQKLKWAMLYYKKINLDLSQEEYKAMFHHCNKYFDYCFMHRHDKYDFNITSVQDRITEEMWQKFILDDGDHFSNEGHTYIVEEILEKEVDF